MRFQPFWVPALVAGLLLAACRPDTPATEQGTRPAVAPPAAVAALGNPADTLHLPGGRIVQLSASTAAAFNRLPAGTLPDMPNDPAAERLEATGGKVRRQGLDLLLQPSQGDAVRLASTPDSLFTIQNAEAVKYQYWGSLPAAHQWVVRAWYWESSGVMLVDQRTGRRLALMGDPVAAPDGRFVLLTSPGLGGGDQLNALTLASIGADGARLLWQREPTVWEPQEARWAGPGTAILKVRHLNAQGEMPDDAPETYVQLPLGR